MISPNNKLSIKDRILILILIFSYSTFAPGAFSQPIDYDIIYVRYPIKNPEGFKNNKFVNIPQGEKAYRIIPEADLVLLKPDGSENVLVDCDESCSVYDPYISYDGKTVYYMLIDKFEQSNDDAFQDTRGLLYKIHLDKKPFSPIQLTYDEGFDSLLYAGNTSKQHDQGFYRHVRDMAPVPLADGRIIFTSNRAGLTAFNPLADEMIKGSLQELYVMDDHEGELNTAELANLRKFDVGGLHLIQHPIQLIDGRILFSTWQDAGTRIHYANTALFTLNPDGTNLQQFTEPHSALKYVDHFVTQMPNEDIAVAIYYPSFDYGFGVIARKPIGHNDMNKPDFLRGSIQQRFTFNGFKISRREFDRKGTVFLTPHTTPADIPAPNRSGKYSYPSMGLNGNLLVAYSKGYVNWFSAACQPKKQCEALRSGIYLIPDAMNKVVTDPKQLIKIKDDKNYNEIFPRAVVPYSHIYGISKPKDIPWQRSATNGATALMGTSSMLNRESAPNKTAYKHTPSRERTPGNWTIQGADAGVYTDDDVWGVRIVSTPPKVFTKPINKRKDAARYVQVKGLALDSRISNLVGRYGSVHGEKWEILGEFPLPHTNKVDLQGNKDTSWKAKVPADTPLFIQTIDNNGMTLNSELTWRGLKSGEARLDCGGCHAHSLPKLDYATTQSGKNQPIQNIKGIENSDHRIQNSTWDLTTGSIPIVGEQGHIKFIPQPSLDVEFFRDIEPIITTHCASCHNGKLEPDFSMTGKALYLKLAKSNKAGLVQMSPFIRAQQARASLLTWIIYNQRTDGRTNQTWKDDLDYPSNHPAMALSTDEKRKITRWIDMGNPINFPDEESGFEYTADSQLPVVTQVYPSSSTFDNHYHVGFYDAKTGLNWNTLNVAYYKIDKPKVIYPVKIDKNTLVDEHNVLHIPFNKIFLKQGVGYVLKISIEDAAGNRNVHTARLVK